MNARKKGAISAQNAEAQRWYRRFPAFRFRPPRQAGRVIYMAETIFWWVFLFTCIFGFFFSYGVVENLGGGLLNVTLLNLDGIRHEVVSAVFFNHL